MAIKKTIKKPAASARPRRPGPDLSGLLRHEELLYRATIDAIDAPLHVVDRDLRLVLINQASQKWLKDLGIKAGVIGRNIFEVFPFLTQKVHREYQQVFDSGRSLVTEEANTLSGRIYYTETRKMPILEKGRVSQIITVVRDITRRKEQEKLLLESEQKFRRLAETISAGIFIYRGEQFVYVNPYAEEAIGYSRHELENMKLWDVIHPDFRQEIKQRAAARQSGKIVPDRYEVKVIRKDGGERWVDLTAGPVEFEGQPAVLITAYDITARYKIEKELEKKAAALARSNDELRQFVYVASHDLQEPLRMIANYAELLERRGRDKFDQDEKEFLGYVRDGAETMQLLIADLLAYSRVSLKEKELAPVDFHRIVDQVLVNLGPAIKESGARVISDRLPVATADGSQMAQLFQNLIGNALKYHGDQPPQVRITAAKTGQEWQFAVSDNGIGIAPEYHDRIFLIFERLHNRDKFPGTGVGLAICKKIVEKHGGRIWLESQEGRGSTFYFTIPIREVKNNGN